MTMPTGPLQITRNHYPAGGVMNFARPVRPNLRAVRIIGLATLILAASPLRAQFTGTWSGVITEMTSCPQATSRNKPITISLVQSGSNVSGVITTDLSDVCDPTATASTGSMPLTGTASGNTFSGIVIGPGGPEGLSTTSASMTITGTSMTFLANDAYSTVSGTLTQSGTGSPASGFSGSYSGTFTETYPPEPPCTNTLFYTGPMSSTIVQTGSVISGLVFVSMKSPRNCQLTPDLDLSLIVSGELAGNSVTGTLVAAGVNVPLSGSFIGSTFSGTITGTSSTVTFSMTRGAGTVAPSITMFAADPATIGTGGAASLRWTTANATSVSIDQGVGTQLAIGSVTVKPTQTTTYTLTATSSGGTATASTTVTVSASVPIPKVVVSEYPQGLLQSSGGPLPTDRFTLTNVGGMATTVTLDQTGTFFSESPTLFTLPPGASQVIVIRASQQTAGTYEGSSIVSASGAAAGLSIPVLLLVTSPPPAPVAITTPATRSETPAPASQNPSGSVSFTNSGAAAIQGMVVADVPWIVPANPFLTLSAGETRPVPFSIDRTRRPDGTAPVGGATGSLTFRYVNAASGKAATLGTTIISNVSVSVVDVVTLSATAATPPALGTDVAIFLSGVSSKNGTLGDLTLSNRSATPVTDLKIYFTPAGGTGTQVVSVPPVIGQSAVNFPGIVKNLFGLPFHSGTIQLRSSQLASNSVAVASTQVTPGAGQNSMTVLPVSRSDRGVASGDTIFLPGVQKSSTRTTSLYVQEVTGNAASLVIEFVDADGKVLDARNSDSVPAYGSLELADVVPAGAAMVRVKNTSASGGKIDAWALVLDSVTSDAFAIVQVLPASDPMYLPSFDAASSAGNTMAVNLTNASPSPIAVTVTSFSTGMRRRTMAHSTGQAPGGSPVPMTIPAGGFRQVTVADAGMIKLAGSTALRAAAVYSVTKGSGAIGSGVAAMPIGRALPPNGVRRFAGIEDASPDSIAAGRALTYRNNLMLAEVSGQAATVRLTLRYVFSAGSLTSGSAVSSRDFSVPAGGGVLIRDLAKSILGDARASFGDLHNATLDILVTSSAGSVLPFLQVIDNGSGEATTRHE